MKKQILLITAMVLLSFSYIYSQNNDMWGTGTSGQILKVDYLGGLGGSQQLIMEPSILSEKNSNIGIGFTLGTPTEKLHVVGNILAEDDVFGTNIQGNIKTLSIQPTIFPNDINIFAAEYNNRFLLQSDGKFALGYIPETYSSQVAMFDIVNNINGIFAASILCNDYSSTSSMGLFIKTTGRTPGADKPIVITNYQDEEVFKISGNGDVAFSGILKQNSTEIKPSKWLEQGDNIYYNEGNVGIGITNPNFNLHVSKSATLGLQNENSIPSGEIASISAGDVNNANRSKIIFYNDYDGSRISFAITHEGGLEEVMGIEKSGRLVSSSILCTGDFICDNDIEVGNSIISTNIETNTLHSQDLFCNLIETSNYIDSPEITCTQLDATNLVSQNIETNNLISQDIFCNYLETDYFDTPNISCSQLEANNIWAQEIIVDQNDPWPDFVFEKDYDLLSLTELEEYISINNHLPEIPSANQVKEDGINVAEMNSLLLKKVEELTLYIIELKKDVQENSNKIRR